MHPVLVEERNPYLHGKYAPVTAETVATDLSVIGELPTDIRGLFVRNGPNPHLTPKGRYHWFDGDGMLHGVFFENGKAHYRNRYVRTEAFERERAAGEPVWGGLRESARHNPPDMPFKDTANTDVIYFNGHLVPLWYISGKPYKVDPMTLETLGVDDFGGRRTGNVSAHSKTDLATGELLFFDYGPKPPFMTYGVVGADGILKHFVPIDLPGARLPHDMTFTANYSILHDFPVMLDERALKAGHWAAKFDRELPARFGVIPRYGASDEIRWFEASPCYIYHSINAWEDGDSIVMVACRTANPLPPLIEGEPELVRMMRYLKLDFETWRWTFNLSTGQTTEEKLCDRNTEFPSMNLFHRARPSRYSYHGHFSTEPTFSFDGLMKFDTETGREQMFFFGPGRYGSEPQFAPRIGSTEEDDGYVLSFVHDENDESSEVIVLDARNFTAPPVARVRVPVRVPLGFHGTWVDGTLLPNS